MFRIQSKLTKSWAFNKLISNSLLKHAILQRINDPASSVRNCVVEWIGNLMFNFCFEPQAKKQNGNFSKISSSEDEISFNFDESFLLNNFLDPLVKKIHDKGLQVRKTAIRLLSKCVFKYYAMILFHCCNVVPPKQRVSDSEKKLEDDEENYFAAEVDEEKKAEKLNESQNGDASVADTSQNRKMEIDVEPSQINNSQVKESPELEIERLQEEFQEIELETHKRKWVLLILANFVSIFTNENEEESVVEVVFKILSDLFISPKNYFTAMYKTQIFAKYCDVSVSESKVDEKKYNEFLFPSFLDSKNIKTVKDLTLGSNKKSPVEILSQLNFRALENHMAANTLIDLLGIQFLDQSSQSNTFLMKKLHPDFIEQFKQWEIGQKTHFWWFFLINKMIENQNKIGRAAELKREDIDDRLRLFSEVLMRNLMFLNKKQDEISPEKQMEEPQIDLKKQQIELSYRELFTFGSGNLYCNLLGLYLTYSVIEDHGIYSFLCKFSFFFQFKFHVFSKKKYRTHQETAQHIPTPIFHRTSNNKSWSSRCSDYFNHFRQNLEKQS